MTAEQLQAFVGTRRWQFARSQPWNPHEYTIRDWKPGPEADAEFNEFLAAIATQGWTRWFGPRLFAHLDLDGWSYFSFGGPFAAAGISNIINRKRSTVVEGDRSSPSFADLGLWDPLGDPDTDLHRAKQMAGSLESYESDREGWLIKSIKYRERNARTRPAPAHDTRTGAPAP